MMGAVLLFELSRRTVMQEVDICRIKTKSPPEGGDFVALTSEQAKVFKAV
ncbi:hypothetical protein VS84_01168 [Vibrio cholerae]|nr:hypothetical protein VS84_01168 [Vibrio cholerae]